MPVTVQITIIVPFDADHLDRIQRFGCGLYLEFITAQERNRLLSVSGGGLTLDDLRASYPANVAEIDAQSLNGQTVWASAATPTVKSWYVGSFSVTTLQWLRVIGWLATQTDKWIRCNYEGPTGDELNFDSAGTEITGMPPPGTNTALQDNGAYLLQLAGIVPWDAGFGDL